MYACMCGCVLDREGSWVCASSTALVVITNMDGHVSELIGFLEPLSPPYIHLSPYIHQSRLLAKCLA